MNIGGQPGLSAAHIADASDYGMVMCSRITALWPGASVSGPAFTVQTPPGDNASLHQAIEVASEGHVLVVDGRGFCERALWGAIMSKAAQGRGLGGLVVDGAVRDVSEIQELGFPVFAAGRTPNGPYNKIRGRIGGRITCGEVDVDPGDIIRGDADGVVVIRRANKAAVLGRAALRHELEQEIVAGLDKGAPLSSLLPILRTGSLTEKGDLDSQAGSDSAGETNPPPTKTNLRGVDL